MRAVVLTLAALALSGCVATKIVTIPIKAAAKTVEAVVDTVD